MATEAQGHRDSQRILGASTSLRRFAFRLVAGSLEPGAGSLEPGALTGVMATEAQGHRDLLMALCVSASLRRFAFRLVAGSLEPGARSPRQSFGSLNRFVNNWRRPMTRFGSCFGSTVPRMRSSFTAALCRS